jgi:hypothetical protein
MFFVSYVQNHMAIFEQIYFMGFFFLFHLSVCLFWYHSVFVTLVLLYNLKSGYCKTSATAFFYFVRISLGILGL